MDSFNNRIRLKAFLTEEESVQNVNNLDLESKETDSLDFQPLRQAATETTAEVAMSTEEETAVTLMNRLMSSGVVSTELQETANAGEANPVVEEMPDSISSSEFVEPIEVRPAFTLIDVKEEVVRIYATEYFSNIVTRDFIADPQMLLDYMVSKERQLGLTVSFEVCGVDPRVFKEICGDNGDGAPAVITLSVKTSAEAREALYECVEVDGRNYLSCVSESLNPDYVHQVIADATEALYLTGKYVFTLVGPRPIESSAEQGVTYVLDTLKLNSYELGVLTSYMLQRGDVDMRYCIINGRTCIEFTRSR